MSSNRINANEDMWQTITGSRNSAGHISGGHLSGKVNLARNPEQLSPKCGDPELEILYGRMADKQPARDLAPVRRPRPPMPAVCKAGHDMAVRGQLGGDGYWDCRECGRLYMADYIRKKRAVAP